jgi:RND superfamily putative drug exporter
MSQLSGQVGDRESTPNPASSGPETAGGRRLRRYKWPVLVLWLIIIAVFGGLGGKLSGVEKNDASAYLPGKSEAAKVTNELENRPGGKSVPGVLVYTRAGGLTTADKAAVDAAKQRLACDPRVENPCANQPAGAKPSAPTLAPRVVSSPRNDTVLLTFLVRASDDSDKLQKDVNAVRATLQKDLPPGLTSYLAGPAGQLRDSLKVFNNIDGVLLLVSGVVVAVILLITYRSPVLFLLPLVTVGFAVVMAQGLVYLLARAGLTVNGQSAGILTVLVFGAGTDYALLLIARYREELHHHRNRHDALMVAIRQAYPAILASGATVIIGLLCLLVSELNSDRGLGPVGAAGIFCALLAMTTLLPTLLVVCGRWVFWPFIPRMGEPSHAEDGGWARVAGWVDRRHRAVWAVTTVVLVGFAFAITLLNTTGLRTDQQFRGTPESVQGQKVLEQSFPAGASAPAQILVNGDAKQAALDTIRSTPGVTPSGVAVVSDYRGRIEIDAVLDDADGPGANAAVDALRERLHALPNADALVGGQAATTLDVNRASARDLRVVVPIVLVVVFVILALLLRALLAPLVLMATVVLSFFAALGASGIIFQLVGFSHSDPSFPLFGFIFLVALGIDYNIFLMSRVREEAQRLGTRRGVIRGLTTTGGVITSAGVVLAATFSVLCVLPLVPLIQIGIVVAIGVLLDTFVVRSLLVPALTIDIGRRVWWPSRLADRSAASVKT